MHHHRAPLALCLSVATAAAGITAQAPQPAPGHVLEALLADPGAFPPIQDPANALEPGAAGPAQRIWSERTEEVQELWFRRRFELPAHARGVRLVFTCDNECTVWLDGRQVARSTEWEKLTVLDLDDLPAGEHALAVHGRNTGSCAALALWLVWTDPAGERHALVTDREWRLAAAAADGWTATGHDDAKWSAASEQGATAYGQSLYGGAPRGIVFVHHLSGPAAAIGRAASALAAGPDDDSALRSLEEIEREVMRARQAIWERRRRAERPR